jgi:hypothetical protein
MRLAWLAILLSFTDGALTLWIGSEANPVLQGLFERHPLSIFVAKLFTVPFFIFLARRPERIARDGLALSIGAYATIVAVELQVLLGS